MTTSIISSSNKTTKTTTTTSSLGKAFIELCGIMLLKSPIGLRIWIIILMSMNQIGIILFPTNDELKIVGLIIFPMGALIMSYLYQYYGGFSKLLGLGHTLWLGMIPWLYFVVLPKVKEDENLFKFLMTLIVIDGISVILDIKDVYEYFIHQRTKPTMYWNEANI